MFRQVNTFYGYTTALFNGYGNLTGSENFYIGCLSWTESNISYLIHSVTIVSNSNTLVDNAISYSYPNCKIKRCSKTIVKSKAKFNR